MERIYRLTYGPYYEEQEPIRINDMNNLERPDNRTSED